MTAARCRPALARILFQSTFNSSTVARRHIERWVPLFVSQPNWSQIGELLLAEEKQPTPVGPRSVARAHLARAVAAHTGWSTLEAPYWLALLQTEFAEQQSEASSFDLLRLSSVDRCVRLADGLLQLRSDFAAIQSLPDTASVSIANQRQRDWQRSFPHVDWPSLLSEADVASRLRPQSMTPAFIRILRQSADSLASRANATRSDRLLAVALSTDATGLTTSTAHFVKSCISEPIAVWIAIAEENGIGVGGDNESVWTGSLTAFESERLPPSLRQFRDLTCDDERVGRIYLADNPIAADVEAWLNRLGTTLAIAVRRFQQEAGLARIQKWAINHEAGAAREMDERIRGMIAEFSAGAGHEINNPLGAIAGKVQWLLPGEIDPQRRQALKKIADQVTRIGNMIRDLHFIGKAVRSPQSDVSLAQILNDAVVQAAKRTKNNETVEVGRVTLSPCDESLRLRGNRADLARMIAELIVNGVKAAGPSGTVCIEAGVIPADNSRVSIRVTDSGPGFAPADIRHAFDPFYSGRSAGRGLGMGLPVAARVASEHAGIIEFSPTRPTTVTVTLPTKPVPTL